MDFIPAILIAIINLVIPEILQLFVSFEKWDYNSTAVSQMMWRLYITRFFNILIVYFLNITLLVFSLSSQQLFTKTFDFGMNFKCSSQSITPLTTVPLDAIPFAGYLYNNCREDEAIVNFFLNVN